MSKHHGGLGVKDLSIFKVSIHVRRILPLLNKKDLTWVNLIVNKHNNIHPWNVVSNRSSSWATKAILKAMIKLREGMRKQIGNDIDINIWNDPWINGILIVKWPTYINMSRIGDVVNVSELMLKMSETLT